MKNCVPTSKLRHLRKSDEGQALVLAALGLVVLMLMAGLGVDVGYLRYQKQQMQKAADAGALAGASAYIYSTNWKDAAKNDTAANGFKDTVNGVSVRVDKPWEGPFKDQLGYVEVSVSQSQPTFFMRVGGFNTVPVRSWAVASALAASTSGCIYVTDPSDPDTYTATGVVTVNSSCGIYVKSGSTKAFKDNGSACTYASTIAIVGLVDVDACSAPSIPTTGIAPFNDPLSYLQPPPVNGCDYNNTQINKSTTLSPGTYCGGIQVSGSSTVVTFESGLYVLDGGGLKMSGGGSLKGTGGVMFYNTGTSNGSKKYGSIDIEGVTNSKLTASTTDTNGTLAGILFFDDRLASTYVNNPVNIITGASGNDFTGALYFPSTALHYSGGTQQTAYTIVVAYQFTVSGNAVFNDNYSSLPGGPPIHSALLAE